MKRTVSALAAGVLGAGLALAGVVAPASATSEVPTNTVVGACNVLTVDLAGYAVEPGAPAVTETVVVTPAVAEVSHTDYEYQRWRLGWLGPYPTDEFRWVHKWVGEHDFYDWGYYNYTGNQKKHVEVAAQPEVTEEREVTPAIPADATPNTVTVEIDGAAVVDAQAFGAAYARDDFALAKGTPGTDAYGQHSYRVTVSAYQGVGTEPVESVVAEGTTSCDTGAYAAAATIDTETTCGAAVVALTNAELATDAVNGTYSALVFVDGALKDIVAVFENAPVTLGAYTFAEDSGDHVVEVRTGPAHGDVLLAEATVDSDCVEDPTEEPEPVDPTDPALAVTGQLKPGGTITVTGSGFDAGTEYQVELHSTPQVLGTASADDDGSFELDGVIPASTPAGAHRIVVLLDGEEIASTDVTITSASTTTPAASGTTSGTGTGSGLASTGIETGPLAALAAALLALAGIAFGARRVIRGRA
ncbi:hypothetical protein ACGGZK_06465 [Agromyces sp. MMS24-K17]|uniref:hypothetical protein n=1 Tax=Agromyces sp. MMS24-K17 TaxID=3372850 RepID=UPI0037553D22